MIGGESTCPGCGAPLRLSEGASRKAGKLVYACRTCDKRYSLRPREAGLVEEDSVEDSGARTARMPAYRRRAESGAERLTEQHRPSTRSALPEGLALVLDVTDGPQRGKSVRVGHSRSVVGREEGEIRIRDPLVSRRHAVLEVFDAETIILKDLASTNGTYHNGRLIDHCKLQDGDEIRFGSTILNVVIDSVA